MAQRDSKLVTKSLPACLARTQFGQILQRVSQNRERFLVTKNGEAKAVILGIEDFLQAIVKTPKSLVALQAEAKKRQTDTLTLEEIEAEIDAVRQTRQRKKTSTTPPWRAELVASFASQQPKLLGKANRNHRPVDSGPIANVLCGIKVRMGRIAATAAGECGLTDPVTLRHMGTDIALLARISWINHDDRHPGFLSLVLDEETQLSEGPAGHLGALRLAKPCTCADALQIFQGQTALGVLRCRNERLTDPVVRVPAKRCFAPCHTLQCTADVLGTFAVHLTHMGSPLQALPASGVARPTRFNVRTAVRGGIARGGQVDHAKVHAKKIGRLHGRGIRKDDGRIQIPVPISVDNINLPVQTLQMPGLVLAIHHSDDRTSLQGQQADVCRTLPTQQMDIIGHRAIRAEDGAHRAITFEHLDGFPNRSDGHLGRQAKTGAQLPVTAPMDGEV